MTSDLSLKLCHLGDKSGTHICRKSLDFWCPVTMLTVTHQNRSVEPGPNPEQKHPENSKVIRESIHWSVGMGVCMIMPGICENAPKGFHILAWNEGLRYSKNQLFD